MEDGEVQSFGEDLITNELVVVEGQGFRNATKRTHVGLIKCFDFLEEEFLGKRVSFIDLSKYFNGVFLKLRNGCKRSSLFLIHILIEDIDGLEEKLVFVLVNDGVVLHVHLLVILKELKGLFLMDRWEDEESQEKREQHELLELFIFEQVKRKKSLL